VGPRVKLQNSMEVNHMFTDPQSVTINSVAKSLPRVLIDGSKAIYKNSDESVTLTISHQRSGNRTRSMLRLDQRKAATDLVAEPSGFVTLSTYLVLDRPDSVTNGFSMTEVEQLVAALTGYSTTANVDKLYGREI
jgi:hypothetical protein